VAWHRTPRGWKGTPACYARAAFDISKSLLNQRILEFEISFSELEIFVTPFLFRRAIADNCNDPNQEREYCERTLPPCSTLLCVGKVWGRCCLTFVQMPVGSSEASGTTRKRNKIDDPFDQPHIF
jgi:hypothetical protein